MATDVSVPAVSRKSTNRKAKAVPIKPAVAIKLKSSWKACSGLGTAPTTPLNEAVPVIHAMIETARIPMIIAPGTPRRSRTAMITKPIPASSTGIDVTSPRPTNVAGLSTTIPAFWKPIIAKNRPIPAPTPSFMDFGIELMIYLRAGVRDKTRNAIPATNTAANAC